MKYVLATAAVAWALTTAAVAQTVEFRGAVCLTAVSATCPASGWDVGDCQLMRYSPPGLGTNGPTTEISLFGQSVSDNYTLATGSLVGTVMKPIDAYHVGRDGYKYSTTMRITKQAPATLLSTSPAVTLSGNINNFSNSINCNVAFRGRATLRP